MQLHIKNEFETVICNWTVAIFPRSQRVNEVYVSWYFSAQEQRQRTKFFRYFLLYFIFEFMKYKDKGIFIYLFYHFSILRWCILYISRFMPILKMLWLQFQFSLILPQPFLKVCLSVVSSLTSVKKFWLWYKKIDNIYHMIWCTDHFCRPCKETMEKPQSCTTPNGHTVTSMYT